MTSTTPLDPIRQNFAHAFIKAISSKSVKDCADLVLTYEDCAALGVDYNMSERAYRRRLMKQSKNFLKEKKKFIDEKNKQIDSAINIENFEEIDTYEFKLEEGYEAGFIKTISILMKKRVVDGICYQVGFQIDDAVFVNGKIRVNNMLGVTMSEGYWEHITKENTPYTLVQDQIILRDLVKKHAPDYAEKYYMKDVLRNMRDWYVHEGDLELESYSSVKVGLIITGNLTIKEPVVEVTRELIVLGKTNLNTLFFDDVNNMLFIGGIDFETAILVTYSTSYLIFNQPKGPLFYSLSESCEIDDRTGIKYVCEPSIEAPAVSEPRFLLEGFYRELEPEEQSDPHEPISYELNYETTLSAIRAGKPIFKS